MGRFIAICESIVAYIKKSGICATGIEKKCGVLKGLFCIWKFMPVSEHVDEDIVPFIDE